jgi:hypothetical protein
MEGLIRFSLSKKLPFLFVCLLDLIIILDGFVRAMELYGFPGLSAFDIVTTGKQVREEMAVTNPDKAAGL